MPRARSLTKQLLRPAIARNLLTQQFSAARPDTVRLADITDMPTGEGLPYLPAVLDLATRKIVGWSMREPMRTELTSAALMMTTQRQRQGPASSVTRIAAANTPPRPIAN